MRKRYLKILIIAILTIIIIFMIINNPRMVVYINEGIYLPKPQKIEVIYNFEFREGEDLEIWYYNEKGIGKIINKKIFENVNEHNEGFIKKKLQNYYEILDDDEKRLFNTNVHIESIATKENYFTYLNKGDNEMTWFLLVLDCKNGKLYYFNNVY